MAAEYGNRQNDFIPVECRSCTMFFMCPRCAAWAETETGSVYKNVEHLCEYAKCLERKFFKKREERHEKEALSKT
jgi:sulfatase maturation enzyme AslB (radical SAM superfamily)